MPEPTPVSNEPPAGRQCGRCRKYFAADPTAHPTAIQEWWLCASCYEQLLGTQTAGHGA